MPTRDPATPRRSRGGGIVVPAVELEIGDRLEMMGATRPVFFPIIEIGETPKTLRLVLRIGIAMGRQEIRVRKTTLVARGLRDNEKHLAAEPAR